MINKCDLEGCPDSLSEDGIEAAYSYMKMDAMFKVSAKTGENVDNLIQATGRLSIEKSRKQRILCKIF